MQCTLYVCTKHVDFTKDNTDIENVVQVTAIALLPTGCLLDFQCIAYNWAAGRSHAYTRCTSLISPPRLNLPVIVLRAPFTAVHSFCFCSYDFIPPKYTQKSSF